MKVLKLFSVCAVSIALGMVYSGCERHNFEDGIHTFFDEHHGTEEGAESHGKHEKGKGEHKGGAGEHGADGEKGAESGRKVF